MNQPAGTSRTVVSARYALFSPDGFVPSKLPGWSGCTPFVLISSGLGARFVQMIVALETGARGSEKSSAMELVVYVLEGACALSINGRKHELASGHFAFVPAGSDYEFANDGPPARLLIFQKSFEPLVGEAVPEVVIGDSAAIEGKPFLGNPRALLQTLLPDTLAFDMAVNIFTYQPGAALPFVETHIMEHGLLMLSGAGIYRLDADWFPVQGGDVIWMAPYCPQWFAAIGDTPASYIYYKDVNRSPA